MKLSDIQQSENQEVLSDKIGNSMGITPLSSATFPSPLANCSGKKRDLGNKVVALSVVALISDQ